MAIETEIAEVMTALAGARGPDKTICPSEVARRIGGDHPDGWGPLMPAVRRVAVRLMKEGAVVIRRKGRPVDPDDFKGVYRISMASPHAAHPGGSRDPEPD